MSIWNRVQQISESTVVFRPFDVNSAAERPGNTAQLGLDHRLNVSRPVDDFEELLPTGD
jgi:hypothetical protein